MKKNFLIFAMTCIMALGCTSCNAENIENNNDITVIVNGIAVEFDQKPVIVDERTLVPLRTIFEALGATVDWNGETQTVTSTRANTTVSLTIGSDIMTKNDMTYTLDVPAQIINERTLVPVRAIAEAFGSVVDWNGETQTVIINDNAEQSEQQKTAALNHTYTTRFGTVNAITYPKFAFDYSDNWTVVKEEVTATDTILEWVTLTNDRGVEINYIQHGDLSGGKIITQYEVTKAADSQFIPGYVQAKDYSYLGNFMVGEIKAVGEYDMKTGELIPFDGGISYAVIPESYIGTHEAVALAGYQEEFSFYDGVIVYADTPEGGFTEDEKQEVIQILSSFRVVE